MAGLAPSCKMRMSLLMPLPCSFWWWPGASTPFGLELHYSDDRLCLHRAASPEPVPFLLLEGCSDSRTHRNPQSLHLNLRSTNTWFPSKVTFIAKGWCGLKPHLSFSVGGRGQSLIHYSIKFLGDFFQLYFLIHNAFFCLWNEQYIWEAVPLLIFSVLIITILQKNFKFKILQATSLLANCPLDMGVVYFKRIFEF